MRTTHPILFAAALSAVWLTGCSTVSSRISADPAGFAQLPPDQQALVKSGQIGIGFSAEAVKLALGNPTSITLKTNASGQTQVWHYADYDYYNYGPYWGWGWGGPGWGGRHGWAGWGWGDPYFWGPPYPVQGPDRIRVEFQNDRVVAITQEAS